ncbi:hypothetical protein VQH23_16565 [Pararoseomonas sp. SCSIO 73927]|uniref:hypothetical protein n=1 Tax=Pararoseomonas sp. SCSIO 73927 TaxID=3114537 RepID=UPI0030CAFED0
MRIGAVLLVAATLGACAGQGLGGLSLDTPYGRGTANRIDSNREESPSRLYGWDPANRQVGYSIPTGR